MYRVLQLEDDVSKFTRVSRKLQSIIPAQVDREKDVESGFERLVDELNSDHPYDLVITDMSYPLAWGEKENSDAGDIFIAKVKEKEIDVPIITCSSQNFKNPDAIGNLWYSDLGDWEKKLEELLRDFN